jgi:ABC-type nickel/cobalt efflux system permease component RcnA
MSFGDKGRVAAGKKAMSTASIGMVIIMGAWVIVNYVVTSLTGS